MLPTGIGIRFVNEIQNRETEHMVFTWAMLRGETVEVEGSDFKCSSTFHPRTTEDHPFCWNNLGPTVIQEYPLDHFTKHLYF